MPADAPPPVAPGGRVPPGAGVLTGHHLHPSAGGAGVHARPAATGRYATLTLSTPGVSAAYIWLARHHISPLPAVHCTDTATVNLGPRPHHVIDVLVNRSGVSGSQDPFTTMVMPGTRLPLGAIPTGTLNFDQVAAGKRLAIEICLLAVGIGDCPLTSGSGHGAAHRMPNGEVCRLGRHV